MEKVLWLIEHVKGGLWCSVLQIFHWKVLHGWVDQLKLFLLLLFSHSVMSDSSWLHGL